MTGDITSARLRSNEALQFRLDNLNNIAVTTQFTRHQTCTRDLLAQDHEDISTHALVRSVALDRKRLRQPAYAHARVHGEVHWLL